MKMRSAMPAGLRAVLTLCLRLVLCLLPNLVRPTQIW